MLMIILVIVLIGMTQFGKKLMTNMQNQLSSRREG